MNILTFDTALDKMYVSLGDEEKIISSEITETTKEYYHSAFLISTIRDILKENGLTPKDVDLIATNTGPGSFTGIRACTTVARVFAQEISKEKEIKTIGICSLEILSRIKCDSGKKNLIALDARKDMAYVAIYDNKKEFFAPQTVLMEELKKMIKKEDYVVITDNKLSSVLGGISYKEENKNLGKILREIATEKINAGFETSWKKLHPLYIQPPPFTVKK